MSFITPEIDATRGQVTELAARRAYEDAWRQFAEHQSAEEFCASWLLIQCNYIRSVSDGVVVMMKPGTSAFAPVAYYPENPPDRAHLAQVIERALASGHGVVEPREQPTEGGANGPRYQLAFPVRLDGQVCAVIGVDIDWRTESQLQTAMRDLQWGSGWIEVLLRRHADPSEAERHRLKLALDLVSTLLEQPSLKESTTAFTTDLAARLGCDRVALGLLTGRRVKVSAVSHSPQFERRANLMRAIESAMEEAVDQADTVVYPPEREGLPVVVRAHEALVRERQSGSAATFPLFHGNKMVGALTLERASGYRFDVPTLEICEAVAAVAGPIIELKRVGESGLPAHAGRTAKDIWEKLAGPEHAAWKLATAAVIVVVTFFAFATGDYRISANSTLEGTIQRAITAPINGYVKDALLRAGDTVKQGQIIGRFDDRDLKLERVKLSSQRDQYIRQYREAMGKLERAQAQIVSSQIAQNEAQLALVDEQLARTVMVAPFEGVIVSGDLSQSLGSPVERGQVLFEIAPLDTYRVVVQVDERDISYVAIGQHGELTVSSIPGERFGFAVTKVTPVNTAKEGRNFFRAEALLDHPPGSRMRPGMEGVAKIYVDERKLIWIWTHSLIDWVRLWIWSWLP
jgi:biotin carboxyl carrier protein